jgi:hypothetical protein
MAIGPLRFSGYSKCLKIKDVQIIVGVALCLPCRTPEPQQIEATMEIKVDIFLRLPDGKPLWVEAVEGYDKAKLHIQQLTQVSPGEYFIFDSRTGQISNVS